MARKKISSMEVQRASRTDPTIRRVIRFYGIAGVLFTIVMAFCMVMNNTVYMRSDKVYDTNTTSLNTVNAIWDDLTTINENVLLIATGRSEQQNMVSEAKIEKAFADIENLSAEYREYTKENEVLDRRFTHAMYAIQNYQGKYTAVKSRILQVSSSEAATLYQEQLQPVSITAGEMLDATIAIGDEIGRVQDYNAKIMHGIVQDINIVLLIVMLIALKIGGKYQVVSMMEVKQQAKELTEASNRLTKSRKKLIDSAMTNILTGMKNRYALDESLAQLIGNAQFNIAVFDIDNFRVINDMYGYEFGDEYLATIAERLKTEYSEHAEMFNITGNEFCLVFYEHISDLQAQQLCEQIRQGIGQPVTIADITIQTTASASLYHYLPSDNLDVNTLLMKMDTALHAAKHDGGNRMYQIQ